MDQTETYIFYDSVFLPQYAVSNFSNLLQILQREPYTWINRQIYILTCKANVIQVISDSAAVNVSKMDIYCRSGKAFLVKEIGYLNVIAQYTLTIISVLTMVIT